MTSMLPEKMTAENKSASAVQHFFKEHKIGKALRRSNFSKQKGFPCSDLLQFLVMLVFTGKNLFRYLHSDVSPAPFGKDSIYRFLNDCHHNWRKFLLLVSSQIIRTRILPLTSEERINVFIVDDSLFNRSRSRAVELLARVRDHVANKYVRGFRRVLQNK
mgnify:CR=1 FL=1